MIKICIDPGHGGSDRANKGPTGYVEADGNLAAARYLKEELETTGAFSVRLTRAFDETVGLRFRADIGYSIGADLFLSIHSNAHNGVAKGPECFYSVDLPGDKVLAAKMTASIAKLFNTTDRGAKVRAADPARPGQSGATKTNPEDFYAVIDQAQDRGIPHVLLIETLFHDNPVEEAILKEPRNLKLIARALAIVICEHYNVKYGQIDTLRDVLDINKVLVNAGIPALSIDYWPANARAGKTCDGGSVAELINRVSKAVKSCSAGQ
jgi:N-acetylmuramoyl-L-alanine amidase